MKQIHRAATAVFIATVSVWGSSNAAASQSAAGCGGGYELLSVDETLARIDQRPYLADGTWQQVTEAIALFDLNADGLLCSKRLPSNSGQDAKSGFEGHWSTNIMENRAVGQA
jgi:hypothetical protein